MRRIPLIRPMNWMPNLSYGRRGDYRTLLSFQKTEVIYDITFRFAHKFLSRGDRTIDQMIQSASAPPRRTSSNAAKQALLPIHPILSPPATWDERQGPDLASLQMKAPHVLGGTDSAFAFTCMK